MKITEYLGLFRHHLGEITLTFKKIMQHIFNIEYFDINPLCCQNLFQL